MLGLTWSGFNGLSGVGILNFLVLQLALINCGDVSNAYPAKMLSLLSVDALPSIGGNYTCYCSIDGSARPELLFMLLLGALDKRNVIRFGCCLTIVI